eukprot:TRINITY_DN7924_c0_g1::TRINITY_DN7924_c0_g1_i1::g.15503::m.15503 TRINITY_DN7924_c0_g1::TRINITY_DN7924_c0_g1_i1::g.15503  ORF type:complete len:381 (+),score=48.59,sp/Q5PQN9/RM38_RAT/33.33/1e-26,PBP/PF01161.15/4.1e-24 TRINITY_DN7924_c0_g1_i1:29-1144(+)
MSLSQFRPAFRAFAAARLNATKNIQRTSLRLPACHFSTPAEASSDASLTSASSSAIEQFVNPDVQFSPIDYDAFGFGKLEDDAMGDFKPEHLGKLDFDPRYLKAIHTILRITHKNPSLRALTIGKDLNTLTNAEFSAYGAARRHAKGAEFWNVTPDLLDKVQFRINLSVNYPKTATFGNSSNGTRVFHGNVILPASSMVAPTVTFPLDNEDPSALYTLVMVDPDSPSRARPDKGETLHWMVSNIPGNQVAQGKELMSYLPPLPARNSGPHRYVFILFQHSTPTEFSLSADRKFHLREFMRTQSGAKAVGLTFFQALWDTSVPSTCSARGMPEPFIDHIVQARWPFVEVPSDNPAEEAKKKPHPGTTRFIQI